MSYYFTKTLEINFNDAIKKVTEELKMEGFGILTEIDVKETLNQKLNVEYPKYKILGACNPPFAYRALQADNKIGTMLPCNVIVRELGADKTEISAIDPVSSMQSANSPELIEVAVLISKKLKKVINNL